MSHYRVSPAETSAVAMEEIQAPAHSQSLTVNGETPGTFPLLVWSGSSIRQTSKKTRTETQPGGNSLILTLRLFLVRTPVPRLESSLRTSLTLPFHFISAIIPPSSPFQLSAYLSPKLDSLPEYPHLPVTNLSCCFACLVGPV